MTYFPHNPLRRAATPSANPPAAVRPRLTRDILWNQPVFKAPILSNPRIAPEPLPFTATRLTRSARRT